MACFRPLWLSQLVPSEREAVKDNQEKEWVSLPEMFAWG